MSYHNDTIHIADDNSFQLHDITASQLPTMPALITPSPCAITSNRSKSNANINALETSHVRAPPPQGVASPGIVVKPDGSRPGMYIIIKLSRNDVNVIALLYNLFAFFLSFFLFLFVIGVQLCLLYEPLLVLFLL